jgi:hypothetical protein
MATPTKDISAAKDIYQVTECLNEAERDILKQVRARF